ncbi:MAG: hypothetical protein KBT01_03550, partial [Clostridiales bacterium]|nr:hypothetical protein [Candidatus Blautia equi]
HPDGTEETVKKMLEPLAADFRGETTGEIKKAMKDEILRLLAPMFSLNYDDLKRRHRERKIRRMITVAASVSAASILFGSYCAYTAMKIKKQNVIIEEQSEVLRGQKEELQVQADTLQVQADELQAQATELQAQKEQLEEQAVQLSEQNEQLEEQAVQLTEQNDSLKRHQAASLAKESGELLHRDYRKEAIQVAYSALTEYDGAEMPVTPDAVRALTNAVGIYDGGRILKASVSVSAPGKIESLLVSPEGKYMLSYDSFQCLILWDALEMKEITRVEQVFENGFGFLGENAFYYNNDEDGLTRVDVAALEKTSYSSTRVTGNILFGQAAACEGTRLAVRSIDGIAILDGETLEGCTSIHPPCSLWTANS